MPPRLAYLGPEGSFSHEAASPLARELGADLITLGSIGEVAASIGRSTDLGLVPLENSEAGFVPATLTALAREAPGRLRAVREALVPIEFVVCARPGTALDGVSRLLSHPMAFAQCEDWIRKNLPSAQRIEVESTSLAALRAAAEDDAAALASFHAAQAAKLAIYARGVQSSPNNMTRFLLLAPAASSWPLPRPLAGPVRAAFVGEIAAACGVLASAGGRISAALPVAPSGGGYGYVEGRVDAERLSELAAPGSFLLGAWARAASPRRQESREPPFPENLEESAVLRRCVQELLRDGGLAGRLAVSNVKRIARNGTKEYRRKLASAMEKSWIRILVSEEERTEYQHDLVGFLKLLDVVAEARGVHSCDCIHAVLDGGRKTRNFILTLFFGYQVPRSMQLYVQELTLLEGLRVPSSAFHVLLVTQQRAATSDFDLLPASITVQGRPLRDIAKAPADFVLFTQPVPPDIDAAVRACRDVVLAAAGPDFAKLPNERAAELVLDLAAAPGTEPRAAADMRSAAAALRALSSKGVVWARRDGPDFDYVEKPSVGELFVRWGRLPDGRSAEMLANIMYCAISKSVLDPLRAAFEEGSRYRPGRPLRHAIPFGFYATLWHAPRATQEQWDSAWARAFPAFPAAGSTGADAAARAAWTEDGRALRRIAAKFMAGRRTVVASVGQGALVGDLGEPALYLEACLARATHPVARAGLAGLPATGSILRSAVSAAVAAHDPSRVLIVDSALEGPGRILIDNRPRPGAADPLVVVISNSLIRVAASRTLLIGAGEYQPAPLEDHVAPGIVIESSSLDLPHGGRVDGPSALLVGMEWPPAPSDLDREGPYFHHHPCHVAACVRLLADDGGLGGAGPVIRPRFPIGQRANEASAAHGGRRPLDLPLFAGLHFDAACSAVDVPRSAGARATLRARIAAAVASGHDSPAEVEPARLASLDGAALDARVDALRSSCSGAEAARALFALVFGSDAEVVASAPGRLNGGAAHTDWSFGPVMGFAIHKRTYVAASRCPAAGQSLELYSADVPIARRVRRPAPPINELPLPHNDPSAWSNYVVAAAREAAREGCEATSGVRLLVASEVPQGAGLSSSAALEVATLLALARLSPPASGPLAFAAGTAVDELPETLLLAVSRIANRAENLYCNVASGFLDQGVSALARAGCFTGIECRADEPRLLGSFPCALSAAGYSLLVIETGSQRRLAAGGADSDDAALPLCERPLTEFNRRVHRYWLAVRGLLTALPLGRDRRPFTLDSDANPALACWPWELEAALAAAPPSLLLVCEPELNPASDINRAAAALGARLGCGGSEGEGVPVALRREAGAPHARYAFAGCLPANVEPLAAAAAAGLPAELLATGPLLEVVRFHVREAARVRALFALLSRQAPPRELASWVAAELREHAAGLPSKQAARARLEEAAAEAVAAERELSRLEAAAVQAALGDLSWVDKRDAFRGDGPGQPLQRAYDAAESAAAFEATEGLQLPDVVGKVAPGAGWGGAVAIWAKPAAVERVRACVLEARAGVDVWSATFSPGARLDFDGVSGSVARQR
eukprot:tig00000842_g4841.t1